MIRGRQWFAITLVSQCGYCAATQRMITTQQHSSVSSRSSKQLAAASPRCHYDTAPAASERPQLGQLERIEQWYLVARFDSARPLGTPSLCLCLTRFGTLPPPLRLITTLRRYTILRTANSTATSVIRNCPQCETKKRENKNIVCPVSFVVYF